MLDDLGPNQPQDELGVALARTQRSIANGEFLPAAQLLGWLGTESATAEASATFEAARVLCLSCAEQLRLASELESAAREQEASAQLIRSRIQDLLSTQLLEIYSQQPKPRNDPPGSAPPETGSASSASEGCSKSAQLASPVVAEPQHDVQWTTSSKESVTSATEVRVAILGPLVVTINRKSVTHWGSQKSRTLFQCLVLSADRPVRRELLMELLWSTHSSRSARNNLNVCLYELRQILHRAWPADQYVVYRDGCYLLNPAITWRIDRDEFLSCVSRGQVEARAGRIESAIELYQRAVSAHRGQLFEDDPNCDWCDLERRSLEERQLAALDDLAALYLRTGNVEAARNTAQRALQRDSCRESAHRVLMRCYSQQHQQSLVARQFRRCIAALREELAVSPTRETVRLFQELTAAPGVP